MATSLTPVSDPAILETGPMTSMAVSTAPPTTNHGHVGEESRAEVPMPLRGGNGLPLPGPHRSLAKGTKKKKGKVAKGAFAPSRFLHAADETRATSQSCAFCLIECEVTVQNCWQMCNV